MNAVKLIDIGFGNTVNSDRIVAVISAEAAPSKRIVSAAKERNEAIDATCGKRTKAVIVMDSGHVVMSAKSVESISGKVTDDEQE